MTEQKRITVRLDVSLIECVTRDGKTISEAIRTALEFYNKADKSDILTMAGKEVLERARVRVSMKQIERMLELCSRQDHKLELPFPDDRPLMLVDYQPGKQPKILRVSSLSDVYEYLENAWHEAIMAKERNN